MIDQKDLYNFVCHYLTWDIHLIRQAILINNYEILTVAYTGKCCNISSKYEVAKSESAVKTKNGLVSHGFTTFPSKYCQGLGCELLYFLQNLKCEHASYNINSTLLFINASY